MNKSKRPGHSAKKDPVMNVHNKFDKKREEASHKTSSSKVKRTSEGTIEDSPEEQAP